MALIGLLTDEYRERFDRERERIDARYNCDHQTVEVRRRVVAAGQLRGS